MDSKNQRSKPLLTELFQEGRDDVGETLCI